jgi:hypothetical protein
VVERYDDERRDLGGEIAAMVAGSLDAHASSSPVATTKGSLP